MKELRRRVAVGGDRTAPAWDFIISSLIPSSTGLAASYSLVTPVTPPRAQANWLRGKAGCTGKCVLMSKSEIGRERLQFRGCPSI